MEEERKYGKVFKRVGIKRREKIGVEKFDPKKKREESWVRW